MTKQEKEKLIEILYALIETVNQSPDISSYYLEDVMNLVKELEYTK